MDTSELVPSWTTGQIYSAHENSFVHGFPSETDPGKVLPFIIHLDSGNHEAIMQVCALGRLCIAAVLAIVLWRDAALKVGGAVVTWGDAKFGGNSSAVRDPVSWGAGGEPAFETEKRERAAVPSMVDKPNSGSTSRALMNLLVDLVGPLTVTAGPEESHCSNQARRYLYGWTYPNNAEQHDEARAGLQFILLGIYIYMGDGCSGPAWDVLLGRSSAGGSAKQGAPRASPRSGNSSC